MQRLRPWLPPILAERRIGVPAEQAGIVIPPAPQGSAQRVIEVNADGEGVGEDFAGGMFNCCDVYINAPSSWLDLTMRIRARNGAAETPLDMRSVADMQFSLTPTGNVQGLLFSIRGKPASKYIVEAFKTDVAHADGLVYAVAWGGDNGVYGDRNTRLPVDLHASPNQQIIFTTANTPLVAGAPVVALPANPTGGGVAIAGLTWTTSQAAATTLTLQQRPSPIVAPTISAQWVNGAIGTLANPIIVPFVSPLYGEKGNFWELLISGGAVPALHSVNIRAFNV